MILTRPSGSIPADFFYQLWFLC